MDKKPKVNITKILKTVLCIVLSIVATVSMLGATLINVARNYLQSEEFYEQVEETSLDEMRIKVGGQKTTVSKYIKDNVKIMIKAELDSKMDKNSLLSGFLTGASDDAIDAIFTTEFVDELVKSEVLSLLDFFLNSDVDEARERLKKGESITKETELTVDANPESYKKFAQSYARNFVIKSIEDNSGMSADIFIILLSEETVTKLIVLSVALLLVILALNIKDIFKNLLYGGFISLLYSFVINFAQNKFDSLNKKTSDLVGYVFLKPLADEYSTNKIIALIIGVLLIAAFAGVYYLFKNYVNQPEKENK